MQSSSSSSAEIRQIEEEKQHLQLSLDSHKEQFAQMLYTEAVKQCRDTWQKIVELEKEPNAETNDELRYLKESFILVVCAEYQQSKLISYWGYSPQCGMTYILLAKDVI